MVPTNIACNTYCYARSSRRQNPTSAWPIMGEALPLVHWIVQDSERSWAQEPAKVEFMVVASAACSCIYVPGLYACAICTHGMRKKWQNIGKESEGVGVSSACLASELSTPQSSQATCTQGTLGSRLQVQNKCCAASRLKLCSFLCTYVQVFFAYRCSLCMCCLLRTS